MSELANDCSTCRPSGASGSYGSRLVLPAHVGELGLQEQLIARDPGGRDCRPDSGLEVVLALVRRVDAPEPDLQRQPGQPLGPVLLPRSAVQEPRHPHPGVAFPVGLPTRELPQFRTGRWAPAGSGVVWRVAVGTGAETP